MHLITDKAYNLELKAKNKRKKNRVDLGIVELEKYIGKIC